MSYPSETFPGDNFIVADDEPEPVSSAPAASQNARSAQPAPPFWAPKVDLSSAFTPFVTSNDFQQNNSIREHQFQGGDTLDEPVWHTLRRDLVQIGHRLVLVVWPASLQKMASRVTRLESISQHTEDSQPPRNDVASHDWDLWGPLIFSLVYSVAMGASYRLQTNKVFSLSFSIMWLFYLAAGINIQLLGGSISLLSVVSATGYSVFPIVGGTVVGTLLISYRLIRLAMMSLLTVWSIYAASVSLSYSGVAPDRMILAIYPIVLMYILLAWLAVIF